MRIDEFEFQDKNWNEIEPTKNQLVIYIKSLHKQITEIKQQLEEKEKEISNLNGLIRERDKQIKNLKTNKKRVIEHKNNVKISFCIEQLEKVKETTECILDNALKISSLNQSYYDRLLDEIDNQIKQLKEWK